MVVGWTLHACKHRTLRCQLEHCNPFRRPTVKFEERQKYRKQLMSVWLNSVSDDLDLITGKSEFVLFCCVLWCVLNEDSAIRILHLNIVCLYLITFAKHNAFASRMY